ncbi:MAG: hypothetical protein COV44_06405 [Deltaproteobacteria bacterium CG11_big_fil_rev_8_21_14_0_20_45_16]|nr:MAG: hypothetical protein COV44_06405 [Deltaproteobacteria bacterium CG11_big_fil_rev_8_21_14_0_20_45_16]
MDSLISIVELAFVIGMLGLLILFIFHVNLAWSWAQNHLNQKLELPDILSAAAIEWGGLISIFGFHLKRIRRFYEAPPLLDSKVDPQQIPIIFIPSLHHGPEIFHFLFWRLKRNFWNSLWPLRWKSYLQTPELLEDQLAAYVEKVMSDTKSPRFRIISFGTSRPIVARLLNRSNLKTYCDKWIAISAPNELSAVHRLLNSERTRLAYEDNEHNHKEPDLLIVGERDLICYPPSVWGNGRFVQVAHVGHYGAALHSLTTTSIIRELSESA